MEGIGFYLVQVLIFHSLVSLILGYTNRFKGVKLGAGMHIAYIFFELLLCVGLQALLVRLGVLSGGSESFVIRALLVPFFVCTVLVYAASVSAKSKQTKTHPAE
jgi:hypothetical protein